MPRYATFRGLNIEAGVEYHANNQRVTAVYMVNGHGAPVGLRLTLVDTSPPQIIENVFPPGDTTANIPNNRARALGIGTDNERLENVGLVTTFGVN